MSSIPLQNAILPPPRHRFAAVLVLACALLGGAAGCEELDARRKIQEAGRLYEAGRFEESAQLYEKALELAPQLEVGNYNAAIAYLKLFRAGITTPENMKYADRAAYHIGKYLEGDPSDNAMVQLLTQLWLDAGRFDAALQYWERDLAKNPKNVEVMQILAGIYRQAGQWERAIDIYYKVAEVEQAPSAKASAYKDVAKLTSNKLFSRNLPANEILRVADIGIAALQKAEALTPDDFEIQNYLGSMYSLRAEAHQAAWAQLIDAVNGRHHYIRWGAMRKAAEQALNPGAAPASTDGATESGAGETSGDTNAAPGSPEKQDGQPGAQGAGQGASPSTGQEAGNANPSPAGVASPAGAQPSGTTPGSAPKTEGAPGVQP